MFLSTKLHAYIVKMVREVEYGRNNSNCNQNQVMKIACESILLRNINGAFASVTRSDDLVMKQAMIICFINIENGHETLFCIAT